jgi:short-subunit dehydrogenase/acyl dehydratase/acyl carrier protein
MVTKNVKFDDFSVGDYTYFERTFLYDDYKLFSKLSGDKNPLHSDSQYASSTKFSKRIVPLHLTISPLSAIAGMIFPGKPSLYLDHEVRAIKAVYFDEKLIYTAKIISINRPSRILTLSVLVIRNIDVVVEAIIKVQSLEENWTTSNNDYKIYNQHSKGYAVVTGASGEIGQSVALNLAKDGWNLLLQDRGKEDLRKSLTSKLQKYNVNLKFFSVDLSNGEQRQEFINKLVSLKDSVDMIIHTASSSVDSTLEELVATNFTAIKEIIEALMPNLLIKQNGKIINISSVYVAKNILGWENYTAAKTMTAGYVNGLKQNFTRFGIEANSIYPGVVRTKFSEKYREDTPTLMVEEVTAEIMEIVKKNISIIYENGNKKTVNFGLYSSDIVQKSDNTSALEKDETFVLPNHVDTNGNAKKIEIDLLKLISKKLKLQNTDDLANGGIDITPGWDSLAQIDIIISIESFYGFNFDSSEIPSLLDFRSILDKVKRKLAK